MEDVAIDAAAEPVEAAVESEEAPAPAALEQAPALLEALLFASGEPLSVERLSEVTGFESQMIEEAMEELRLGYLEKCSGIELVRVAEKFQLRTREIFAPFVRTLRSAKPRMLSAAALETLSIVAYRQPVVRSDIEKIRGVDATPTIKTLLERKLIKIVGHQATVGQPALFGTTEEFLKIFGLKSLGELPTLRDIKELEADPGEIEEQSDGTPSEALAPAAEAAAEQPA